MALRRVASSNAAAEQLRPETSSLMRGHHADGTEREDLLLTDPRACSAGRGPRPRRRSRRRGRTTRARPAPPTTISASSGPPKAARSTSRRRGDGPPRARAVITRCRWSRSPPSPRPLSGSASLHAGVTVGSATITSCAIRSPARDLHLLGGVEVHHGADHLAAVAGVDQAGGVGERQPVLGREPDAGQHEARVPVGDRDGDAGGDHRALARARRPRPPRRGGRGRRRRGAGPRGACLRVEGAGTAAPRAQSSMGSISSSRLPNGSRTWHRRYPSSGTSSVTR